MCAMNMNLKWISLKDEVEICAAKKEFQLNHVWRIGTNGRVRGREKSAHTAHSIALFLSTSLALTHRNFYIFRNHHFEASSMKYLWKYRRINERPCGQSCCSFELLSRISDHYMGNFIDLNYLWPRHFSWYAMWFQFSLNTRRSLKLYRTI